MNRGQARHKGQTLGTTPWMAQLNTRNRERRHQLNSCGRSEMIYSGLPRVKGSQVVVALMETSAIVEHELVRVRDADNGYEEAVKWKLTGKSQCTAIQHPARAGVAKQTKPRLSVRTRKPRAIVRGNMQRRYGSYARRCTCKMSAADQGTPVCQGRREVGPVGRSNRVPPA